MTTHPTSQDRWAPSPNARAASIEERLRAASAGSGPDSAGALLPPSGLVAEAQAALEELVATEEELRVQGEQLAQAEGALEAQRRRYQELFDFAPDALLLTDARGVILEASHAVSALVGFARAYTLNKPLAAFVHVDSIATLTAALERLRGAEGGRVQAWSMRFKGRRSGPPRDVAVRAAPVRADDGALLGLRWSLRDVTEETAQAAALAAIRTEHERELRTRTMELEMVARMQAVSIAHNEQALKTVGTVVTDAARALHHGAEPRALLAQILDALSGAVPTAPPESDG